MNTERESIMGKKVSHILFYISLLSLIPALSSHVAATPVFPGATGFGTDTRAAYGGSAAPAIYRVTNLNASGSGSLRDCAEASEPRICIFEVAGTIDIDSNIDVGGPYLTIAGQTAPSPGITVKGAAIKINGTHDVLIQHIAIRPGDEAGGPSGENRDALQIMENTYNVVIDHVSTSWGTDETVQFYYDPRDCTVSNSIVSETLYDSIHAQGPHSKNFMIGPTASNISVVRNLLAHGNNRNVRSRSPFEMINNIVYNWGFEATTLAEPGVGTSVIGNVYIEGNNTESGRKPINFRDADATARLYVSDNSLNRSVPSNQWDLVIVDNGGTPTQVFSPPIQSPGLTILPNNQVEAYVLANVGSRPADRDSIDTRIVSDVINGTGQIIDSQNEVGGWIYPDGAVQATRSLTLPSNPHADSDGNGYTNLEEWLHEFAAAVEGGGSPPPPPPPATTQCSDGTDNDNDGLIDSADPGCTSASDNDERDPPPPVASHCSDGLDNDFDGMIDYPADPDCDSPEDKYESHPPSAPVNLRILSYDD